MASIRKFINKSGTESFQVQVRVKGAPPQFATFERKTDAKRWAEETQAAIRNGRYFSPQEARKRSVAEMIDRYVSDVVPTKPKAARDLKSQLAWWRDEIGSYALAELTPAVIAGCRDRLLAQTTVRHKLRSPATVLRYLATLSTVLTTAIREWNWLERSPMEKVTKPKAGRGRVRYLSDDERSRLLSACRTSANPYLYVVVVLAISTGMRLGEIMNIKWETLDIDDAKSSGRVFLLETKNGDRRTVAIAGLALKEIRALRDRSNISGGNKLTGLVFRSLKLEKEVPMDLRTPWESALRAAEINDFHFHDLRHTAASYLAMNGATVAEIAEILGHRTLQMVKRYTHLSESHTSKIVEKMNAAILPAQQ